MFRGDGMLPDTRFPKFDNVREKAPLLILRSAMSGNSVLAETDHDVNGDTVLPIVLNPKL